MAGTSEFLGPDEAGVEVVVVESRANAKGVREEDALLENGSQSNESDDVSTDRVPAPPSPLKETSFSIGLQVLFPFLLAGFGTVAAGMVLDIVQHWEVFQKVTEVFILVPALLGLKGNLEMTLASRLSTAVSVLAVGSRERGREKVVGNMETRRYPHNGLGLGRKGKPWREIPDWVSCPWAGAPCPEWFPGSGSGCPSHPWMPAPPPALQPAS